ncbi:YeeE/YedE thiosulfate transporter family protein [Marinicella sp. W31]|uniref:YeeE/YedE thiosulfate transporter family protein n=1 Tax=Marinicella sp. W31 TaxID=3023713 RepID=UPI003757DD58
MKKNYMNPYLAGVLLGLVLLTSFVIAGRGIGASGAVSQTVAHGYVAAGVENPYVQEQLSADTFWRSWIVIEVLGIFIGAFVSARLAGRAQKGVVKGAHISTRKRLLLALLGGVLMGFAARLARGCTSGQALTGGALLSVGSWAFMIAVFAGAYLTIVFVRRSWL